MPRLTSTGLGIAGFDTVAVIAIAAIFGRAGFATARAVIARFFSVTGVAIITHQRRAVLTLPGGEIANLHAVAGIAVIAIGE